MSTRHLSRRSPARMEVTHRRVGVGEVTLHVAEAGEGPVVVLLHGFPELWHSWRHQLPALAEAGCLVVAPDLRGYGDSDAPGGIESYRMLELTADISGLLDALDAERAVLVGHDWGARIAWHTAQRYPERVVALAALAVPPTPREPQRPTELIRAFARGAFNLVLYAQQPGVAEAELEADPRRSLRRIFYALSGDAPAELVPELFTHKPADVGLLDGMPDPAELPGWLSDADLDVYAETFARTGFRGALNRYRNLDRDWEELADIADRPVEQPLLFVGGELDSALRFGSLEPMRELARNLVKAVVLPGCGHWTQQERPAEVTREIAAFLHRADVYGPTL